ncbi:hypothetical protein QBC39DRAFT_334885 [Podospora conica]|nr:hypothetical protein QBC39DRAFT_334885 [Schizothecium conicum]
MSRKQAPLGQRVEAVKQRQASDEFVEDSSTVSRGLGRTLDTVGGVGAEMCFSRPSSVFDAARCRLDRSRVGMQYAGSRLEPEVKVWPFEHEAVIGQGERGDGVAKGWVVLVQDPDGNQRSFWEAMASEASHGEGQPIDWPAQELWSLESAVSWRRLADGSGMDSTHSARRRGALDRQTCGNRASAESQASKDRARGAGGGGPGDTRRVREPTSNLGGSSSVQRARLLLEGWGLPVCRVPKSAQDIDSFQSPVPELVAFWKVGQVPPKTQVPPV